MISALLMRSPAKIRASNFRRSLSDVTDDASSVRTRQPTLLKISAGRHNAAQHYAGGQRQEWPVELRRGRGLDAGAQADHA
jgi:hypothetical protein